MASTEKIINSFYLQDELNPEVWDSNKSEIKPKLNSEIRDRLLKIANLFIDFLNVEIFVHDVYLLGSLTGYNWSEFSDFDLHIIYDFNDAGEKKETYEELFRLKKTVFNSSHDIRIKGYEVELYVQDLNEENESMGVYSLIYDKWLKTPQKEDFKPNEKKLKEKAQQWMDIIDGVLENAEDEDLETATKLVDKYKEKIRKYRSCGLKKEGEFSYENLVFKYLRRSGYIGKLNDYKNNMIDKKLSLEQENYE
jgi:predicted nucleotidyltransferase